MTGIDEPTKIVAGLQLLQAGVIDLSTFREMLSGLEQLDRIRDGVRRDRSERAIFESLEGRALEGDPEATLVLAQIFKNPDKAGEQIAKFMTPAEPEISPEEAAFLEQGPPQAGAVPPNVQTVLSQLSQGGTTGRGGVQTVGRVA